jgi:hypothetical protein
LAIVVLNKPVIFGEYIKPICQWDEIIDYAEIEDKTGSMVGWTPQIDMTLSSTPWTVEVPVISQQTCLRENPIFFRTTSERCGCTETNQETSPCYGEYSGGFYMQIESQWFLRGVIAACDWSRPAVFSDTVKFLDWFDLTIKKKT